MSEQIQEQNGSSRKFKFQYGILTDVGRKREENQDSHGHAHTSKASVFLVADGMGGAKGGATASAIAVDTVLKSVFSEEGDVSEATVRQALETANEIIFDESAGSEDLTGMGTTAVLLGFTGDTVIIGHVGDSRSYMVRDGKIRRLTRDHTLVQELVDTGAIKPAEAHNHPIAHMLTRSLGPATGVEVEVAKYYETVQIDDTFLLCCDGLYNLVSDEEIEAILKESDLNVAAKKLIDLALERGGTDNITVEIIRPKALDDSSVDYVIPDPGKLRFVASSEPPPLKAIRAEHADAVSADEAPRAGDSKKKLNPIDDVIFHQHGQEEVAAEEEISPEVLERRAQRKKEQAELSKLRMIGLSVVLVAVGLISYLFLIRPEGRRLIQATTSGQMTLPTVPRVVPTSLPSISSTTPLPTAEATGEETTENVTTTTESAAKVDQILEEIEAERTVAIPTEKAAEIPTPVLTEPPSQPTPLSMRLDLSDNEQMTLEAAQSLALPKPPKLRFVPKLDQVAPAEKTNGAPKTLSTMEKNEIAARKATLREDIIEVDIKSSALDSPNQKELAAREKAVEDRVSILGKLLDRIEISGRDLQNESFSWQERKRLSSQGDAPRLAGELGNTDPAVEEIRKKLDEIQNEYQRTLALWSENRKDPQLVSTTAALSRDMKVQKTRLEIAVQEAVDRGVTRTSEAIVQYKLMKRQLERLLQKLNRQLGFLKAAEPNGSGRNDDRLNEFAKQRRDMVKDFEELDALLPEADERQALEAQLRPQ